MSSCVLTYLLCWCVFEQVAQGLMYYLLICLLWILAFVRGKIRDNQQREGYPGPESGSGLDWIL